MARKHFFYTREAQIRKLDEKGQPIPLTQKVKKVVDEKETEVDELIPGKFELTTVSYLDHFNLDKVIRTHTVREGEVIALLDDGHEVTEKVPVLRNPNKKGPITKNDVIEEKHRVWVQSEILLKGEDVKKYYQALLDIE